MFFGKPPADPKTIAAKIISAIRHPDVKDSSPDWTRVIKKVLREYGQEKGLSVYPSPAQLGRQFKAWLLDVIWYNETTGTISLALESEWGGKDDVLDDFGKLLCIKAPLKVMVYFADQGSVISSLQESLGVFDHHVAGEQYLVVEFHGNNEIAFLYDVPTDGKVDVPRFSELKVERAASA